MRGGEAQYNPLCRRLHGAGRQPSVDASEEAGGRGSDAGVDGGDGESDGSSSGSDVGVDVETEARRARVARLRYQREMRDDIARQLRTLEEIRRERETRAALDGEMAALRRKLAQQHTVDWAETSDRIAAERAAKMAAEAIDAAMKEEEVYASVGYDTGLNAAQFARWERHELSWEVFERRAAAAKKRRRERDERAAVGQDDHDDAFTDDAFTDIRVSDVPWPPESRDMLTSLAAFELVGLLREQRSEEGEAERREAETRGDGDRDICETENGATRRGGPQGRRAMSNGNAKVTPSVRLTAYKRAFKKASLRWHPDKFEGKFGTFLCCERDSERRGGGDAAVGRVGLHGSARAWTTTAKECESDADEIRRRVRSISQEINDAWSAISTTSYST